VLEIWRYIISNAQLYKAFSIYSWGVTESQLVGSILANANMTAWSAVVIWDSNQFKTVYSALLVNPNMPWEEGNI